MKILFIDTETTGLDANKNGIIQMSGMIEVDGEIKEEFNFKLKPFDTDIVEDGALAVSHTTREDIANYGDPRTVKNDLCQILGKYVNKYDKADRFHVAGYNVRFDLDFLKAFFEKCGDVYFGSWINWKIIDPMPILHYLEYAKKINLFNYKLSTVCDHLGIELDAHDAMNDIKATREVLLKIPGLLNA